jgi:hypothetical protein
MYSVNDSVKLQKLYSTNLCVKCMEYTVYHILLSVGVRSPLNCNSNFLTTTTTILLLLLLLYCYYYYYYYYYYQYYFCYYST